MKPKPLILCNKCCLWWATAIPNKSSIKTWSPRICLSNRCRGLQNQDHWIRNFAVLRPPENGIEVQNSVLHRPWSHQKELHREVWHLELRSHSLYIALWRAAFQRKECRGCNGESAARSFLLQRGRLEACELKGEVPDWKYAGKRRGEKVVGAVVFRGHLVCRASRQKAGGGFSSHREFRKP